ncbi:MAG: hypothetical protein J5I93_07125 [Pirellulaceae bacterium]|nr:hypothetical protein [Pirellulaceae bacterium]
MNPTSPQSLLHPAFLFRFTVPCLYRQVDWTERGFELPEECLLPSFRELEGSRVFADLRAAWNEDGLLWTLRVVGKQQPIWCRATRVEDSDGLHIWLDTRDTHNVHRASRFCHHLAFMPAGAGRAGLSPLATLLPINRAREHPKPIHPHQLRVASQPLRDGYLLQAHVAAAALTGFDVAEHPRLGFSYAIVDRELGWQTLSLGPEFPIQEDPSLWGTLELVRD